MAFLPEEIDSQGIDLKFLQPKFGASRVGTSLGDTPELMVFFTQGSK